MWPPPSFVFPVKTFLEKFLITNLFISKTIETLQSNRRNFIVVMRTRHGCIKWRDIRPICLSKCAEIIWISKYILLRSLNMKSSFRQFKAYKLNKAERLSFYNEYFFYKNCQEIHSWINANQRLFCSNY